MHMQVDEIIPTFQDTWHFVFWYTAHIARADVLCCCSCCLFPVYINCQPGFTCMQDLWLWLSLFWVEWLIMLKLHQTCYYNSVQVFCAKIFLIYITMKVYGTCVSTNQSLIFDFTTQTSNQNFITFLVVYINTSTKL
jgi:hypothetical protein